MPIIWKAVLGVLIELLATKNYGHRAFQQSHDILHQEKGYKLGFVEFDDEGKLFDRPESMDALIDHVSETAQQSHSVIVVFVHGWHHNAEDKDHNLIDFRHSLEEISMIINAPKFRKERGLAADAPDGSNQKEEVIGIYVGWRGKAEPMPLDYATFWGRKAAAQRIGTGTAADLLTRLDQLYKRLNKESNEAHSKEGIPRRFTGLIVAGHSFGGALVLSAVESQFQAAMAQVADDVRKRKEKTFPVINGLGDLVVLINPAIEASVYDGIFRASQAAKFSPLQVPILMTISAKNDRARQFWFTGAQKLSGVFRATQTKAEEAQMRHALGEVAEHVTHQLEVSEKEDDPRCPKVSLAGLSPQEMHLAGPQRFSSFDGRSKATCFFPDSLAGGDENTPFLVVKTQKQVVNGHNGVFDPNFRNFLIGYIALSELKRQRLSDLTGAAAPVQMLPVSDSENIPH